MQGAVQVSDAIDVLKAPVLHIAAWLLPLSMMAWAVAAGFGAQLGFASVSPETPRRWAAMIVLQLLRIVALFGTLVCVVCCDRWAALSRWSGAARTRGTSRIWCFTARLVIIFSLGIFAVWALLKAGFCSIAPLLGGA